MLHIGIDDTDSSKGMCTTYIACILYHEFKSCGFEVIGYPRLIRLNPFAPHKTRGNGAVSLRVKTKNEEKIKNKVLNTVSNLAELEDENTDPGIVFYKGKITPEMEKFALKAIRKIVSLNEAKKLAKKVNAEIYKFKKGRGIIGALAAISCPLKDKTYELLAYRTPENYGKERKIDSNSVFKMDKLFYPKTFDNVDNDNILITPNTPCPVLYGIRGETPEDVREANKVVKSREPIERTCIFETNQHTDQHIQKAKRIADMKQFESYVVIGEVKDEPKVIEGGHVFFTLKDSSGEITCAAYEPTKEFRKIVMKLKPGDKLKIYGGIGVHNTLNIEKMKILELAPLYKKLNPLCPKCGKRMKSAGKNKGLKCLNCGNKIPYEYKIIKKIPRNIKKKWYEVPPAARRHLSKPLIRCKNDI
ncbi:tRNA(Ile2) 2-agmatinylcytidine synthetase [Methanothermus fervidus DSM 2088]|uniref:tRNA(Ile2) 2-agmatinylcytidine synthetase TiaS n=1 Tax=Methanothermus fervidus (strain ATCC 43054 / DSM 2088 / JCM 10308 / V24 S) TaxID=523846 RepID=E3GYT5_METFV|nr:tRNA(Ile)(2)-agmatinylcytidine synthase [Methanothermus fervidus]ADP77467.1 tRNA(Ile2) 2-agmatinylcytidine synthetase [Methanothermus fervidus DSM 2088]